MSKQYEIGYYYERKVKQILEKDGYLVWRSPASKSPIDIIAINDPEFKDEVEATLRITAQFRDMSEEGLMDLILENLKHS